MEKDDRSSSAMGETEGLDEEDEDDDEEGGAETEEQSGNESEMNEQEEEVRENFSFPTAWSCSARSGLYSSNCPFCTSSQTY